MILHPGILALMVGSGIILLMTLYASRLGVSILTRWDHRSSSGEQLALERRTYLISTIMNYAFGFAILSLLLFLFTADDIHGLFTGAMCATGSLNANPAGWYALCLKILIFFAASVWIALNNLDNRAEDFPLIKLKYGALLLITPLMGADLYLQIRYFAGLQPEIITSCCGSLFSDKSDTVAGQMAGLPTLPMMKLFYLSALLFAGLAFLCLAKKTGFLRYILSLVSAAFFFVSIAAVISFVSLYIYEIPTHHCPFDVIQKSYRFIGYPLYLSLFGGVCFGLLPGLFRPFRRVPSLTGIIDRSEKKWLRMSLILISVFVALSTWPVVTGSFTLKAYF